MKRLFLFLAFSAAFLISCSKTESGADPNIRIAGTYKLIETLADPGNGSAVWQPVPDSAQTMLYFYRDNTIEGSAFPQAKRYEVVNDSTIKFIYADGTFINYNYTLQDHTLVLSGGGCIEACGARFRKGMID